MQVSVSGVTPGPQAVASSSSPRTTVSMYMVPPAEEISVDEFESMAMARLQVLRRIDVLRGRGVAPNSQDWQQAVSKALNRHSLTDSRVDHISHFILRLGYCRSEDQRRWLMQQESQLFRYRFERLSPEHQNRFLADNEMRYERVRSDADAGVYAQLRDVHVANQRFGGERTGVPEEFFKIPFTEATQLLKRREVLLKGGFVFVPMSKLVGIVVARFRSHLSGELAHASRVLPALQGDRRIGPVVQHLATSYTGDAGQQAVAGAVTPAQLDSLAAQSMPLCMSEMHRALKRNHKLKHVGRIQYGLFLKGCGLSLEDAITFWRGEFTKGMTDEQFQKGYLYNIRFNYGKEGKRTDYTPHACATIINTQPGHGETHGCPFRSYNEQNLRTSLVTAGVASADIQGIVNLVKSRDYQIACRKHFEVTHRNAPLAVVDNVGNHPNAWFESSREFHGAGAASGAEAGASGSGSQEAAKAAAVAPTAGSDAPVPMEE